MYHQEVVQNLLCYFRCRFEDNGKGEGELEGEEHAHYVIEPAAREILKHIP